MHVIPRAKNDTTVRIFRRLGKIRIKVIKPSRAIISAPPSRAKFKIGFPTKFPTLSDRPKRHIIEVANIAP